MDSITSSSKEENESHAAVSQPPQLQSHGGFLQSNSQPIVFNDHLMMVSESSKLIGTPNSNSDYLNVLVNSPSAQPLGFTDRSLSMDARFCRNPARLLMMKSAAQGPVDQSLLTIESMGTGKASRRNRKKRTRASRKPQTTVMMTDTANFRAMVQEFTGIPVTSLVAPSHLHGAGVGLIWPNGSGLGSDLEPPLAYGGVLHGFQSYAGVQELGGAVMDPSRRAAQKGPDKHPIFPRTSMGGGCTDGPVNLSTAPAMDLSDGGDRTMLTDLNLCRISKRTNL